MTVGICRYCGQIIIKDLEKWLEENPNEKYIQCPNCAEIGKINE